MTSDLPRYAPHEMRVAILERDKYLCRYCGRSVTLDSANIDHIVPWKYGGKTKPKNLVTTCWQCNKLKSNQTSIEPLPLPGTRRPASKHRRVGCKKQDCSMRHHDLHTDY